MTSLSTHQQMADLDALAQAAIKNEGSAAYGEASSAQLAAAFASHPDLWDITFARTVNSDDGPMEVPASPGDADAYTSDFTVSDEFIAALRSDLASGALG